ARHLAASAGHGRFERPACDAPWWSSVVEADGRLRPCFFHPPVGDVRQGLGLVRGSPRYRAALAAIDAPNRICEACVCPNRRARRAARAVRPDLPVVWGGWHPSLLAEQCLASGAVDACVIGQGERTFVELVGAIEARASWAGIPGLVWREGSAVVRNPPRPFE